MLVEVARHARLLRIQLRTAALLSLQYRLDFFVDLVLALFWTVIALVPLVVLFGMRSGVAGWTWPQALMVVAFFTMLKGLLSGAIQPALTNVVEHIRKGTLDFLLLKPVDAQFILSTSRFDLARVADIISGLGILAYAITKE